ncbi:MAG: DNA translocase FtsK 4TM domain-containing protein [Candidatus Zambryskibacteria bacterium]|nr:DNA translocase FtsK 4TM domain-containing protein [Candidatus Zambryskibacteria bacterium]
MGRKKKLEEKKEDSENSLFTYLQEETLQGIIAVLFFVLATFFTLAGFSSGGKVGLWTYDFLKNLFGYGYWLLPLLFLILCISFFNSLKKKLALTHSIGGLLFFCSALALLNIFTSSGGLGGKGGVVGNLISSPLLSLFDLYASIIILIAFVVISFLVMFDIPLKLHFSSLFRKKEVLVDASLDTEPILAPATAQAIAQANLDDAKKDESKASTKKSDTDEKKDFDLAGSFLSLSGKEFVPPPLTLLEKDRGKPGVGDIKANSNIIKRTLANFGINVEMDEVSVGPSITRYALKPAEGVKLSRILGLQNDLSLALAAHPLRIEAPIPGKSLVGIEIPNTTKTTVGMGSLLGTPEFQNSDDPLMICLGKGISGMSYFANLAKAPHMLIAGATGSGKSVTIHAVITSLLYRNSPDSLKFIMVDPKRVELTLYNKIPHLLTPVITDAKKAILALKWAAKEMDRRYDILQGVSLQNIKSYHKNIVEPALKKARNSKEESTPVETMPYIVVVIDELADIMQAYPRELEAGIVRLAQMSRAVGIHLILSTQRPSVNVITGLIKANVPTRLALQVASQIDSRTILDMSGAEKLLGAGDMLYLSGEMSQPQRIQSAYISENELKGVVKYLADNYALELPNEIDLSGKSQEGKNSIFEATLGDEGGEDDDDLYEEARSIVIETGKASTSYLQRKLGIGYARAARLIDSLEEKQVIGPGSGAKARDVLVKTGEADPTV